MKRVTVEQIRELVIRNAPIVYLNPKERYLPASFPWYLERVYYQPPGGGPRVGPPVPEEDLCVHSTPANLTDTEGSHGYLGYGWGDESIMRGQSVAAPAYVHVVGVEDDSGQLRGYHVQYWFFYAFNGPATARITAPRESKSPMHWDFSVAPGGDHQGDWEHVTVFVDLEGQFQKIYCAQHSGGTFYSGAEVSFEGTNPVVYSALNGHPSYPTAGTYTTPKSTRTLAEFEFCLINQTAKGQRWDCSVNHEIVAIDHVPGVEFQEPCWLQFRGRAGAVNPNREIASAVAEKLQRYSIPMKWVEPIANVWVSVLGDIENYNGPQMPKTKTEWMSPPNSP